MNENWLAIVTTSSWGIPVTVALMLMGGTFGLPFPEDLVLIFSGILAAQGKVNALFLFPLCVVSVMFGDILMFIFGRYLGLPLLQSKWLNLRFADEKLTKVQEALENRRFITIFIARHLFYLRGITFFCCGLVGMNPAHFVLADFLAACISVPIFLALGFFGARHYLSSLEVSAAVRTISLILGICFVIGIIVFFIKKKKNGKSADELPSA